MLNQEGGKKEDNEIFKNGMDAAAQRVKRRMGRKLSEFLKIAWISPSKEPKKESTKMLARREKKAEEAAAAEFEQLTIADENQSEWRKIAGKFLKVQYAVVA